MTHERNKSDKARLSGWEKLGVAAFSVIALGAGVKAVQAEVAAHQRATTLHQAGLSGKTLDSQTGLPLGANQLDPKLQAAASRAAILQDAHDGYLNSATDLLLVDVALVAFVGALEVITG